MNHPTIENQRSTNTSFRFDAVVFDMDGTLFDTEPIYFDIGVQQAAEFGREFTRWHMDQMIGVRSYDALKWMIAELELPVSIPELVAGTHKLFAQRLAPGVPVIEPAVECLRRLYSLGVPIALATSTARDTVDELLERAGIVEMFAAIATGPEVENSKPAPDVYLLAADRLAVSPDRCVAFEDSHAGATSAKAASMACVAVPTEFTAGHDFSFVDLCVGSLADPAVGRFLER